jgi:hypothetical protein
MLRADIEKAIDELPVNIRGHITRLGSECLKLLNSYLSDHEEVRHISSASPKPDTSYNCLLVLTNSPPCRGVEPHKPRWPVPGPRGLLLLMASAARGRRVPPCRADASRSPGGINAASR